MLENGDVSADGLALSLNVPVTLVYQMAETLNRQGYLQNVEDCALNCERCDANCSCLPARPAKFWLLTEKGRCAVQDNVG